jgi:copper(I)-binding protein
MRKFASIALALAVTAGAAAITPATAEMHMQKAGDIEIHNPWARASAGKARNGGAFVTLKDSGTQGDKLIAAASNVSKKVELHTHIKDGDVMKMRHVPFIPVPAGGSVELKPGSYHIMFMGLKAPLKEGTSFPVTLTFEKSGSVEVMMQVKGVGAMGGAMNHSGHGTMKMKKE